MKTPFIGFMVIVAVFFTVCCNKKAPVPDSNSQKIGNIFDSFWYKMNSNYVYWDVDTTNWDAVYAKYKPLFNQLTIADKGDLSKSAAYFDKITQGLVDGHYSISLLNPLIADTLIFPSFKRKSKMAGFFYPYPYYKVDTNYLDAGFQLGLDYTNVNNNLPFSILWGTISGKILYFSCNHFNLTKYYLLNNNPRIKSIINSFIVALHIPTNNIKGIIIDVRSNGGGDTEDLSFLVGQFISKPLHFGYTQSKSVGGRLSFTPWINAYVYPQSGGGVKKLPMVVLADKNSASLSEAAIMALHTLPKVVLVGETTWGATGPLTSESIFNDGQFSVAGFMTVQTSSVKFKYINGKIYEGVGFPPDINIPFNYTALSSGVDPQLDKAISLLK